MNYKINEIFYSVQGEGARAGTANVFIRFAGCDLACSFCDTEFESYVEMTASEIALKIKNMMPAPRAVILTGGEPALQYDQELCSALMDEANVKLIAIETNGGTKLKGHVHWVSCSPKVADHVVAANFPTGIDEFRYVRHAGQGIPQPRTKADHFYLSPQFNGNTRDAGALATCIALVKENPKWKLSVQQHKSWRVR